MNARRIRPTACLALAGSKGAVSYTHLEDQLKLTKARLEESERKLVLFAQQENLVDTGDKGQSLAVQNLTQLNAALATAQD